MMTLGEFIRGTVKSIESGKEKLRHDCSLTMTIGPLEFDLALEAVYSDDNIGYMTVYQDHDNHKREQLNRVKFTVNIENNHASGE